MMDQGRGNGLAVQCVAVAKCCLLNVISKLGCLAEAGSWAWFEFSCLINCALDCMRSWCGVYQYG